MRNIEKLRNYFLGKDPQLKETMADNSLRLIGIEGKHFVLRTELLKRLVELRHQMEDADEALQKNIDAVIEDLQAEVLTRGNEVTRLDGRIDENAGDIAGLEDWVNNSIVGTIDDDTPANTVPNVGAVKAYVGENVITVLTEDLHIPETEEVTSLTESGWYYTGEHQIYFGDSLDPAIYTQAIFYFFADSGDQWFCFFPPKMENGWDQICSYLWFDNIENKWVYDGIDIASSTAGISDQSTDNSVPTSKAVYDFVNAYTPKEYPANTSYIGQLEPGIYIVPNNTRIQLDTIQHKYFYADLQSLLVVKENDDTSVKYWILCGKRAADGTAAKNGTSSTKEEAYQKSPHEYSEQEQLVGTWIDGKTLYEMTISETVEGHSLDGATIEDVDEIFIKFGYVSDGNGTVRMLPYANGQELYVSISKTQDDEAKVNFDNSSTSEATFTVVVNYTKASE